MPSATSFLVFSDFRNQDLSVLYAETNASEGV